VSVVGAGCCTFDHADGPFRQIANVDQLYEALGTAGREHFAATSDTHRPVSKTISVIVWTNDKSRPNDQHTVGHGLLSRLLAKCFQPAVELTV
jgi:hypothetical protein